MAVGRVEMLPSHGVGKKLCDPAVEKKYLGGLALNA